MEKMSKNSIEGFGGLLGSNLTGKAIGTGSPHLQVACCPSRGTVFVLATEQSPGLMGPAHRFSCLTLGRELAVGQGAGAGRRGKGPVPPATLASGCSDGLGL